MTKAPDKLTESEKAARAKVYATVSKDDKLTEARGEAIARLLRETLDEYDVRAKKSDCLTDAGEFIDADPLTDIAAELAEALRVAHNALFMQDMGIDLAAVDEQIEKALARYRGEA